VANYLLELGFQPTAMTSHLTFARHHSSAINCFCRSNGWQLLLPVIFVLALRQSAAAQSSNDISASTRQQMASILEMKKTFTPAERKMSSNLVLQSRAAAGKSLGAAAGIVNTDTARGSTLVQVDIAGRITGDLLQQIEANGGKVGDVSEKFGRLNAAIPLKNITAIASHPEVKWIRDAARPIKNVGALTSQGYISHKADQVTPVTGAGIKVGVLSDSASAAQVSALIASGDLGANTTVLPGQEGPAPPTGSDEGTAMMEIVQDIAPGAQIYFATAFTSESSFATNIAALATAGCSIIVDDVTYPDEGAFQDGIVAQAVNAFVAGGGLYFSSAANSGNLDSGTSGTWEGDFLDGGPVAAPLPTADPTASLHNFGTAGSPQNFNVLVTKSPFDDYTLQWADPLGGSTNDYDLFILNSTGTVIRGFSTSAQTGTQDPFEEVYIPAASLNNDRVVVVKHTGAADRFLRVDSNRGELSIATSGSTFGHNAGKNTLTVAAVCWNSSKNGTHPFTSADVIEPFSSDGQRRIFFNPDGSAITPGNFSSTGGSLLQKPELAAADGAESKTSGFLPFFGTSAAAPHAAGITALVKSANPARPAAQVKAILFGSTIDIMTPGTDRNSGLGILMARPAVDVALGP
jgi:hypothetical protein